LILLDTSGIFAWANADDPNHARVALAMSQTRVRLVTSPFVVAETDYLLRRRLCAKAQGRFLREIESGAIELARFDAAGVRLSRRVIEQYADLKLSLADASLVVLAHRFHTREILTLDDRDFRVLPGPGGEPFKLLPADLEQ
jgi:predicted nucleic acid-binding protein